MREVHLPVDATEGELELAEQVAVAMHSEVLLVCWTGRRESVSARRGTPRARVNPHPLAALVDGVAGAMADVWDAFVAPLHAERESEPEL